MVRPCSVLERTAAHVPQDICRTPRCSRGCHKRWGGAGMRATGYPGDKRLSGQLCVRHEDRHCRWVLIITQAFTEETGHPDSSVSHSPLCGPDASVWRTAALWWRRILHFSLQRSSWSVASLHSRHPEMISSLTVERHRHWLQALDERARKWLLIVFNVSCLFIWCPSVMLSVSIITAVFHPAGVWQETTFVWGSRNF